MCAGKIRYLTSRNTLSESGKPLGNRHQNRAGEYVLPEPFAQFMMRELVDNNMTILPIEICHTAQLTSLPFHHRDPFDRLIIAQALAEDLPIVSIDPKFDAYGVSRIG